MADCTFATNIHICYIVST